MNERATAWRIEHGDLIAGVRHHFGYTDEELLAALRHVRLPSVAQYNLWAAAQDGVPCVSLIRGRLGGWRAVLRELSKDA